jgi:hypothetical protein
MTDSYRECGRQINTRRAAASPLAFAMAMGHHECLDAAIPIEMTKRGRLQKGMAFDASLPQRE